MPLQRRRRGGMPTMVAFAVELEALDDGVFLRLIDEAALTNLPDVGRFRGRRLAQEFEGT